MLQIFSSGLMFSFWFIVFHAQNGWGTQNIVSSLSADSELLWQSSSAGQEFTWQFKDVLRAFQPTAASPVAVVLLVVCFSGCFLLRSIGSTVLKSTCWWLMLVPLHVPVFILSPSGDTNCCLSSFMVETIKQPNLLVSRVRGNKIGCELGTGSLSWEQSVRTIPNGLWDIREGSGETSFWLPRW